MPSEGNPRVILRMERKLLDLLSAEIERTNERRRGQPYTLSAWIRQAVIEKLKHSARSRGAPASDLAELEAFPQEGVGPAPVSSREGLFGKGKGRPQ